ncbi:MAG: nucleoid-structuring protein H-NS [Lachnospiraceae bacterium]|nr:nucleoid-structuring protein H-NS [Lachnospiraceae bacterium]MCI9151478.1 nucleoid-structuring protein H-NS [Lachnospiraceae bacterium]
MKEISKLMDFRPDIKVLDATLRDGGLVNDFYFTDDFVKKLYRTNVKAGVDYMEFGYKASRELFDAEEYGKWKFCKDEDIRAIVGENNTDLKISVMADVGRCDYKTDILPREESPIDLIRVATYIHTIPAAADMIMDAADKGYEVACNIMAISQAKESSIRTALEILGQTPVSTFYIVDSYGSIYPEEMARMADMFLETAEKYGKKVGIHAHNNLQMAFANTAEAVGDGVDWLDATYAGMGRGAGNCAMEMLLGFLKNPKYKVYYAFQFVESEMQKLRDEGIVWGYDLQYMMTGLLNQHPREAIAFTKDGRKDYARFYQELTRLD